MSEVYTSKVEALEAMKEGHKHLLKQREMAQRLYNNPDFRSLIVEGFMKEDAAIYVQESQDPALSPEMQLNALRLAQASGHLKRYLSVIILKANTAERELLELDTQIEEARVEEGFN